MLPAEKAAPHVLSTAGLVGFSLVIVGALMLTGPISLTILGLLAGGLYLSNNQMQKGSHAGHHQTPALQQPLLQRP